HEVAAEVIEVPVQRERRYGAPPLARQDASRDEPPRAAPIERQRACVHAEEHAEQDHEIRDHAWQPVADLLDAALTDRALVLEHVLRYLRARFRRARDFARARLAPSRAARPARAATGT